MGVSSKGNHYMDDEKHVVIIMEWQDLLDKDFLSGY